MARCAFDAPNRFAVELPGGTYTTREWKPGEKEKYQQEVLGHEGVYDKWLERQAQKEKDRQDGKTFVAFPTNELSDEDKARLIELLK